MEGDAARKEDNLTYSYNFICPQSYHINEEGLQWTVIEKGFERLNPEQLKISVERIKSALSQLGKHINITPWDQIQRLYRGLYDIGFKISLKEELYQVTSSVKARGVVYSLLQLSNEQKRKGVIAISTGSFAHSLCHFGKKFGIPVTIVMIKSAENGEASVVTCLKLGARVYLQDDIVPAYKQALSIAEERGLVYIDGNDHPNMIIGQATLGIEMMEQANDVDAVILPTSDDGCGLTAGIAMAVKSQNPNIKVIKVQYSRTDPLINLVRNEMLRFNVLNMPRISYPWPNDKVISKPLFDTTVTAMDKFVEYAAKFLKRERNVDDFNAAIGLAAILSDQLNELKGKRVIMPVFGKVDLFVEDF